MCIRDSVSSGALISKVLGKQHSPKNTVHKKVVNHLDKKAADVVPGSKPPTKQ